MKLTCNQLITFSMIYRGVTDLELTAQSWDTEDDIRTLKRLDLISNITNKVEFPLACTEKGNYYYQTLLDDVRTDIPFEDQMTKAVQSRILQEISKMSLINMHGGKSFHLPKDMLDKAWGGLNWENIMTQVSEKMEGQVVNSIVSNMSTEIKNDVKKLMSVEGVRERLRMRAYPVIMEVLGEGGSNG